METSERPSGNRKSCQTSRLIQSEEEGEGRYDKATLDLCAVLERRTAWERTTVSPEQPVFQERVLLSSLLDWVMVWKQAGKAEGSALGCFLYCSQVSGRSALSGPPLTQEATLFQAEWEN